MRLRHAPFVALVLLFVPAIAAQTDPADDRIRAEMKRQNIPGLSLAVVRNGVIVKAEGYGFANIKLKTPATPATVYKIASASKQFIATGIMLLVQDGRIRVDDPISKYLEGTPASWNGITIRHLLTHTSGLIREAPGFDPLKIQPDAAVIKTAYPLPLRFAPGAKWEYSNTGFFALAEIIRTIAGRPWSEYLAEKVFRPTGMNSTRTTTTAPVPNLAQGYVDNDALREAPEWAAVRPSGAFLSTVLDLAKWDAALYTDNILTASTRRQMWTPVTLNDGKSYPYGFGWMFASVSGHRLVHHPGGMPGFRADLARFVDDGLTIILLMNLDDVDIDAIVEAVASVYYPERAEPVRPLRVQFAFLGSLGAFLLLLAGILLCARRTVGRTFAYWGTGVSVPAHIVGALIGLMGGHAVLYGVGYPVVLVLLLSRATPSSGIPGSVEDPEPQTGTSHDGAHLMSALAGRS